MLGNRIEYYSNTKNEIYNITCMGKKGFLADWLLEDWDRNRLGLF